MAAPLQVRRVLTTTPLARQHEMMLADRSTRKHPAIPWKAFRRDRYPEPALALAYDAQRMLALGEYTAVDLFARVAAGLALNGAPFDVVAAATRVPCDEIRHADITIRMAALLSGKDVAIPVDRAAANKRWASSMDLGELDAMMVEVPAIGETLACALLSACEERATDPTVHAIYATIVADEVHHARLGWYYLTWRAPQWTRAERQRVADRAGQLVVDAETRFWRGRDAPRGSQKAAHALGVLESKGQRETVRRVMEDEIVPGLDALGLGASHAWRVRRRGK
jgi:hypothetical protein